MNRTDKTPDIDPDKEEELSENAFQKLINDTSVKISKIRTSSKLKESK